MKSWILGLFVLLLVLVLGMDAEARGRRGGCRGGQCGVQTHPASSSATVAVTEAGTKVDVVFGPNDDVVTVTGVPVKPAAAATPAVAEQFVAKHTELHNRDAQGVANMMAARNYVGHFGGNPGYEGCGMAGSPQAAYNICCYSTSGMRDADVGYAKGRNGMWFCCRRYR